MINAGTGHDCRKELNDAELKATPVRIEVLKFLEKIREPVDANMVMEYLDSRNIAADPATVFRMMNSFTQKGLTKQVSFNEGKFRYELASRPEHHHLVCTSCGSVESFSDCAIPELEQDIKKKKKFLVKSHALEFFGLCRRCQA